jgi:hypothetical protein
VLRLVLRLLPRLLMHLQLLPPLLVPPQHHLLLSQLMLLLPDQLVLQVALPRLA